MARNADGCRKCKGPMVSLELHSIGVRVLTKGDCCGACHFNWMRRPSW